MVKREFKFLKKDKYFPISEKINGVVNCIVLCIITLLKLIFIVFCIAVFMLFVAAFLQEPDENSVVHFLRIGGEKSAAIEMISLAAAGLIAIAGIWVANRRAKALEDQAEAANIQAIAADKQAEVANKQAEVANKQAEVANKQAEVANEGNREKRIADGVAHLGSRESSARLSGAYGLYQLAQDCWQIGDQRRSANIIDILHAHIRQTTSNEEYQKTHENQPSEEIQSILDLLFKQNNKDKKDRLRGTSGEIDLSRIWLKGVNLDQANLQGANLNGAQLQRAVLTKARLQRAQLRKAHLQMANLEAAWLQHADMQEAQMQCAMMQSVQLQRADLSNAQMQCVYMKEAKLYGANLQDAQLQGAVLVGARLLGAFLYRADLQYALILDTMLQGAILCGSSLQGATMRNTQFQGADFGQIERVGTNEGKVQFQEAKFDNIQMHGVHPTENIILLKPPDLGAFEKQINDGVGVETTVFSAPKEFWGKPNEMPYELVYTVIFSGGLDKWQISNVERTMKKATDLVGKLAPLEDMLGQNPSLEDVAEVVMKIDNTSEGMWMRLKDLSGNIINTMRMHQDKPASYDPPENFKAGFGSYTKEDAKKWITEFERGLDPEHWERLTGAISV